MKFLCLFLATVALSAQAQAFELYGHWPAEQVIESSMAGQFKVNDFEFIVSDWKITNFIECASHSYAKKEIFLEGVNDPKTGKSVVTAAYICNGEVDLSHCQDTDKEWFCEEVR